MLFGNRSEAGRLLAGRMTGYAGQDEDTVVLGLAPGGIPVAREVADRIGAPLDVFTVCRLEVPGHAELTMGALASGGVLVVNEDLVQSLGITGAELERAAEGEHQELLRRESALRPGRPPLFVRGKVVILVDDGLGTGSSMRAAVAALRQKQPARIVVAVPVGAAATCDQLRGIVNDVVCPLTPEPFFGVADWYRDYDPVTDDEARLMVEGQVPVVASASPA
jgi:putative phosphoribosyl transferase